MNGDNRTEHQRWLTARHEAGHAVAAFYTGCPIQYTTIEKVGDAWGTTRMRVQEPQDAIVLICGPGSEKEWTEYVPGQPSPQIHTLGPDEEGLQYLQGQFGDLTQYVQTALMLLSRPDVQNQIDQVAAALLERTRLSEADVQRFASLHKERRKGRFEMLTDRSVGKFVRSLSAAQTRAIRRVAWATAAYSVLADPP